MNKGQYKKLIRIVAIVFFVLNIVLFCRLEILKDRNDINQLELNRLNSESSKKDEELNTLNEEYEVLKQENQSLIEEYENWQRQNQKLEDMLH